MTSYDQPIRFTSVWSTGHQCDVILSWHDLKRRVIVRIYNQYLIHFICQRLAQDRNREPVSEGQFIKVLERMS